MELRKIDLTKEGEPKYTTFFYHKNSKVAFEVKGNGYTCAISLLDELGLSRDFKFGTSLPKYILKQL